MTTPQGATMTTPQEARMTTLQEAAQYRSLYELTGDIKDFNTMLVPRTALAQQGEPVYQYQMADGSWIDQTKDSYDYYRKYVPNATVRVVYTAVPAPQAQDWKKEPEYVPPLVKWAQEQPAPKGEPVMFAWKRGDGTYHDASGTEHSCGMHPLFAHAEPEPQPAQGVEACMINLPEPVAWFANYGGNVYTEAQLKQAVRDALDKSARV